MQRVLNPAVIGVLAIALLASVSLILWRLNVDWEHQVRAYGYLGVFFVSLITTMTIFLPLPGEVVLAAAPGLMGLESVPELVLLALLASVGAVIGELTAYFAGFSGKAVIEKKYAAAYQRIHYWMAKYGKLAMVVFAFTPLPFDLAAIAAGTVRFPISSFLIYSWIGRLPRALLIVFLGRVGWSLFFG